MKHGKKFLNMRNRKFMMTLLSGLSILITVATVLWLISKQQNNTDISQYNNLLNRRYIQVDLANINGHFSKSRSFHFDLKDKEYFGFDYAIKDKKTYGQSVQSANDFYHETLKAALTSAIFNLKLSKKDIQDNNFTIVRKVYPLLDIKKN